MVMMYPYTPYLHRKNELTANPIVVVLGILLRHEVVCTPDRDAEANNNPGVPTGWIHLAESHRGV